MHLTQCLKKAHDLVRLKRTTADKNRTQVRFVVHFNINSIRKRECTGLPLPGFRLAPPPLISSAHSGEAFVQHLWVWSRQKPSQIHLSLFSRCQRRSKSRALRSFWLLLVKIVEIPEPWGQCSASSTWCLSSTFSSGYVVLRSSATPVYARVRFLCVIFLEGNRLTTYLVKKQLHMCLTCEEVLKVF